MPNKLKRRSEYKRATADLGRLSKLHLRLAEIGIADNPDHMNGRASVVLGGRPVTLEYNGDLRIWFHRLDADTVSLDLVVDVRDLPDWFVQPTGSWFEQMQIE